MEFISYNSYGVFNFKDSYSEILDKLFNLKYHAGEKEFLGKKNKTIYLEDIELQINFSEDSSRIETFEIEKGKFIHLGKNLFEFNYVEVLNNYSKIDKEIKISEDGFETKKFGFGIYRKLKNSNQINKIDNIIAFSKEYNEHEEEYDVDDIINFYLGE